MRQHGETLAVTLDETHKNRDMLDGITKILKIDVDVDSDLALLPERKSTRGGMMMLGSRVRGLCHCHGNS